MTADIRLEEVTRRYGALTAVDAVSVDIPAGTFFSLLGPSGCGKSTLLRVIAGLEPPDSGRVFIGGRDVTDAPPRSRPTAMVFQSYALFPSMTVGENVAYGLRVRRVPRAERERRVRQALRRVHLEDQIDRPVTVLSGGQQQRVAVARAIAVEPAVMLFDEPLSNLDVALRERTRAELRLLQRDLETTSVYVTHDQQEALAVSDVIAVMRAGRIVQMGAPEVLYDAPDTAFVAGFLGGSNVIRDPKAIALIRAEPSNGRVLSVRPEHLQPAADGQGEITGRLLTRQFLGTHAEWMVDTEFGVLRAWISPDLIPDESIRLRVIASRWVRDDA